MTEPSSVRPSEGGSRTAEVRAFEHAVSAWAAGVAPPPVAPSPGGGGGIDTAILVEGASDRAAVEALAELHGRELPGEGWAVLPMGGAMSIRRFVAMLGPNGMGVALRGLCDAGEVRFFHWAGMRASDIHVCHPDLEGELIGALGVRGVEEVLAREGDLRLFRMFQQQPAQRLRPVEQQLHRFLGTTSGRKEHYGRALVLALPAERVPGPLQALLARE
ncbi:TOPRIM nucleotidyl transferase/hydrolase domain-containing protein [Leifsonia sp. PS1209]|uniref:TOPRIM nucleotidyl transferase/hydrolase domain-containing protein n=1 Tax=Leifsonia sp. PS1209 TaxID=2724914 RepID=UPI001FF89DE8|nr:TOPRIM nucleotidyl transferase/hydrolase domain-containing protein [Leifsonia sp. PS1209]